MTTYKRQLWTSGYTYRIRCPYCGMNYQYLDRDMNYRSWYPDGFTYCPGCRRPNRHNEIFAIHPDGTPVYSTLEEAKQAILNGYYRAVGMPIPAPAPRAPASQAAPVFYAAPSQIPAGTAFCSRCGKPYQKGQMNFCGSCGAPLPKE